MEKIKIAFFSAFLIFRFNLNLILYGAYNMRLIVVTSMQLKKEIAIFRENYFARRYFEFVMRTNARISCHSAKLEVRNL